MKGDGKGVRLDKCEPLYLHCGNTFEAVMPEPVRLMALGHVFAKIRKQALDTGVVASHWLLHPALQARAFDAVLLGSSWRLRPSGQHSETTPEDWPRMHASQFSAVTDLGSVSSFPKIKTDFFLSLSQSQYGFSQTSPYASQRTRFPPIFPY